MQIMIDIDDGKLWQIKNEPIKKNFNIYELASYIDKGVPLPKGHGQLIDRDKIEYLKAIHDAKYGHISWIDAIKKIKYSAPTIIEADTEGDIYAD